MKLVNKVIRFTVNDKIPFEILTKYATKVYKGRPTMILFKNFDNTVIIFKSLKGRIMGNPNKMKETLDNLPFDIANVHVQTCTYTHDFNHEINLQKLNNSFHYEAELFPAAYSTIFGAHVNIFHTGKIVVIGVKSHEIAEKIIASVEKMIFNYR